MDGFVRNTRKKKTNATRSTTETLLYTVDMDEPGRESGTAMLPGIPCVSSA
jgi:hypothetical protein